MEEEESYEVRGFKNSIVVIEHWDGENWQGLFWMHVHTQTHTYTTKHMHIWNTSTHALVTFNHWNHFSFSVYLYYSLISAVAVKDYQILSSQKQNDKLLFW